MKILFFITFLLFPKTYFETEKKFISKEETIEQAINNILKLSKEDNIELLNQKYINDTFGIYEIKKIGVIEEFFHSNKIKKETSSVCTIYQVITYLDDEDIKQNITFYNNLKYDCNESKWNKSGLIVSKFTGFDSYVKNNLNKTELKKIELIEKDSYMVVLTKKNLVFYITNLNDRFYITAIDREISDCGC